MAKGLQSWSVKEQGSPILSAEIKTGDGTTAITFSNTTRAMMGVVVPAGTQDLTITFGSGQTVVIPGAAVSAIFAPGAIVPFACDSFVFAGSETAFKVIGLF
jgi:hypothetical protein